MPFAALCKRFVSASIYFVIIVKAVAVMMNDHGIYEHILEDDIFFGVVGMLECMSFFPSAFRILSWHAR